MITFIFLVILCGLYITFVKFTNPKSTSEILKSYSKSVIKPTITEENFKGFSYRKIEIQKDTALPTLVFVHGTIGSINDFSKYLRDSTLQNKANMIAYDRVGYNYKDANEVQESIAFECSHLQDVIKNINPKNVILIGYSYGGPIALSVKKPLRKILLLAPAVSSKEEQIPWMLNFYKWKLTRWLVPDVWKQASKEKMSHQSDLKKFEDDWVSTSNKVISMHGTKDWIVPISNSEFLEKQFPKEKFTLVCIKDARHNLIWNNFSEIRQYLLDNLD